MNINSKQFMPYTMVRNHGIWHLFNGVFKRKLKLLTSNKILCQSVATLLSGAIIVTMASLIWIFNISNIWIWVGFVVVAVCLWLMNIIYLRMINQLFKQLNKHHH